MMKSYRVEPLDSRPSWCLLELGLDTQPEPRATRDTLDASTTRAERLRTV